MISFKFISVLFSFILISVGLQESFSQTLRGLVNEGVEHYEEGNFSDAEVNFKKGTEKEPDSFEAKFNLGDAYFKQERFDDAIKSYKSAMAFAKDDLEKARVHYNIGNSLLKAQKVKESVEEYKKSLRLNPSDQDAKYNLSYALEMLKNKDDQQQQNEKDQNKDKNEDQNKDQNQDQNKNKDEDKKDEQQKDQQNKQDKQKQEQQDKKQQQQQPQKISKEEAERILEALKDNEKDLQKELRKIKGKRVKTDKDW